MERYRHTQIGWVILWTAGLPLIAIAGLGIAIGTPMLVWFGLGLMPIIFFGFGSLTIVVTDSELRVRLGPGPIRRTIPLSEVRHFARIRTRWYHGWGVHFTPSGSWTPSDVS